MNQLNRNKIEKTDSLEEAIELVFGVKTGGIRTRILLPNGMSSEVAKAYNQLGIEHRQTTYHQIADDFVARCSPEEGSNILDLGCGSGLLSLALVQQVKGTILGTDVSRDMIKLAQHNYRLFSQTDGYLLKSPIEFKEDDAHDFVDSYIDGGIDYIICRNVLHRFTNVAEVLQNMLANLNENGKIYLRDVRRDADWKTILKRIGIRWKSPELVRDYLGAMANAFTPQELKVLLDTMISPPIKWTITDGSYFSQRQNYNIEEYAKETEFVCVIEK